MSWREKLKNIEFSIRTGDGKLYKPLWKNSEKSKEFNTSRYEFVDVSGSLVERRKPKSSTFPLVFWFQGEDNIEQSAAFEASANDPRFWTVVHPFYGEIKGQPVNLKMNDNNYNVTEVSVEFWESILEDYPLPSVSIDSEIRRLDEKVNLAAANSFASNAKPEASDIIKIKASVSQTSGNFKPKEDFFDDYLNIVKKASKSANNLVKDPRNVFIDVQQSISATSNFTGLIRDKLRNYLDAYLILKRAIDSVYDKVFFESQAASVISGMAKTALNPSDNEYETRADVEASNAIIRSTYDDYLKVNDLNEVDAYDVRRSWSPNATLQQELDTLVQFASKSLYALSFDARQERIHELEEDSNLILVTHRFIGLDDNDENMEILRNINNIRNREVYELKKGREIRYYA